MLREQEEKIDEEEAQDISSKETETLDSLAGGRHQRKNEETVVTTLFYHFEILTKNNTDWKPYHISVSISVPKPKKPC